MKIIVLLKQIRYVYAQTGSDPKRNYVGPEDIVRLTNPSDEVALEQALRIKDKYQNAEVITISLGDRFAEEGLRRSLAVGANKAIHIPYEEYEELDPWVTSIALAHAVKSFRYRFILCGSEALDDNNGLVGPYVAGILKIPYLSRVVRLELKNRGRKALVHRAVERGNREIMECTLPALFTIDRRLGTLRYPILPGLLRAHTEAIEKLEPGDIETPTGLWGPSCNMIETVKVSRPKPKVRGQRQTDGTLSASERLKLMMKGSDSEEREQSPVIDGNSENALHEVERLMRESGVEFRKSDRE